MSTTEEKEKMGIMYSVTITMDSSTRNFLKEQGYSLYAFKGVDAGAGAQSTVWITVTGSTLYDNASITISWEENFYTGQTSTQVSGGAVVSGINPYKGGGQQAAPLALGKVYIYEGVDWNSNPDNGEADAFTVVNTPPQVNSFYMTQKSTSSSVPADQQFIVVKQILGSSGLATFKPIQVVSFILSSEAEQVGTIITQAFSPGAIVSLPSGQFTATISYNENTGWSGDSSVFSQLKSMDPVYTTMLNASK